jgi:hypothetical protein
MCQSLQMLMISISLVLTLAFMDPFRVAFTLSKSELTPLRKWSEGFLRGGQGKPVWAKNCNSVTRFISRLMTHALSVLVRCYTSRRDGWS